MCGRFGLSRPDRLRLERFGIRGADLPAPSFNVTPGARVFALRAVDGKREAAYLRWGLLPPWAKREGRPPLVNVRSEGAFRRPGFRESVRLRRALVFADVFYEWQGVRGQRGKQPWAVALHGRTPFALGAIWDSGERGTDTCAILTTEPNTVLEAIHDRMPVIVSEDRYVDWLDPSMPEPAVLEIARPWPSDQLEAWPIGTRVNEPEADDESLLDPVDARARVPDALDLFDDGVRR